MTPIQLLDTNLDAEILTEIVEKMIEREPSKRYSANKALMALRTLTNDTVGTTIEVREGLLQSVRMMGRNDEITTLDTAFKESLNEKGCVWLVGGEAGTGKSRLVDELRIRALVRGALVMRGQTITEASQPFQLWRNVISRLILEVDLDPLEASVLKPIVDNIERLAKMETVDDAPTIGAVTTYNRLLEVVSDILKRITRPILIILEDIHLARESLDLLRQVVPLTDNKTLMIVCTYRTNEAPQLLDELSDMNYLDLQSLTASAIKAYIDAILTNKTNLHAIVDLLQHETDGNIMFIIEFLRAIIEDFGTLDDLNHIDDIPDTMLGKRIEKVIRHRMRHIPQHYFEMLEMAAVLGRVVNIDVMNELFGTEQVAEWLQFGEEMMLLRIRSDQWRISNNAIRRTILDDIPDEKLTNLHMQAASAIEKLYGEEKGAVRLAYHWTEAGDVVKEASSNAPPSKDVCAAITL
ncbi:MAG: AAA family ATPase [Chloroflexota bacterium]